MFSDAIIIFFFAFLISGILIPVIVFLSKKYNLFDYVNERKIHTKNISRLGGLAIFCGFFIPFCYFILNNDNTPFNIPIYLAALTLAFLIGFIDDISNIKAHYKLMLQLFAGCLVAIAGLEVHSFDEFNFLNIDLSIVSYGSTILWVVVFMNAINLMDGMDGLASGIVFLANTFAIVFAFYFGYTYVGMVAVILEGAILGFYIYNFPPAKIFMGDGGSYVLGFLCATLPLMAMDMAPISYSCLITITLLIIPVADIILVIFKRIKMGSHIFAADRNHIHHRIMDLGISTRGVLLVLYGFTLIIGLVVMNILYFHELQYLFMFVAILALLFAGEMLLTKANEIINFYNDFLLSIIVLAHHMNIKIEINSTDLYEPDSYLSDDSDNYYDTQNYNSEMDTIQKLKITIK